MVERTASNSAIEAEDESLHPSFRGASGCAKCFKTAVAGGRQQVLYFCRQHGASFVRTDHSPARRRIVESITLNPGPTLLRRRTPPKDGPAVGNGATQVP